MSVLSCTHNNLRLDYYGSCMKCPHCSEKLGLFSKALNKFDNPKVCPKCERKIKLVPNIKLILILAIPVFVLHIFVLKPLIIMAGFSGSGVVGIWAVLTVIMTMQLKSAEET